MARLQVESTINGEGKEFLCDADQSMLDVLREERGLSGTKEGCGTGDCGACSILVDGRLVCACLMLGVGVCCILSCSTVCRLLCVVC